MVLYVHSFLFFCCYFTYAVLLFSITGDEILAVNGNVCHDLTHSEAISLFKSFKSGSIALHICRRSKSTNK